MRNHWTVLIISKKDEGIKRFKISAVGIIVSFILLIGLLSFSCIAGYRLYTLRSEISCIEEVKTRNIEQKQQISMISEKLVALDKEMSDIRNYNRHLCSIAKVKIDTPEQIIGIGGGGADSIMKPPLLTEKILTKKLHSNIKQLGDDIGIEKQVSRELLEELERQRSIVAHTPSIWPTRGWLTSRFGWRSSPFTGKREFHKGVDIASRKNTPIYAPADGIVTSYCRNGGYGNFLVINHGYGIVTRYGHLAKSAVEAGQMVKRGDNIAYIGNTGRSTGSHLHYEVMVNGIHVNPKRYMLK